MHLDRNVNDNMPLVGIWELLKIIMFETVRAKGRKNICVGTLAQIL